MEQDFAGLACHQRQFQRRSAPLKLYNVRATREQPLVPHPFIASRLATTLAKLGRFFAFADDARLFEETTTA
jgi:hypothetical protein